MILLWGMWRDSPLAAIHSALTRRGASVVWVNQEAALETDIELAIAAEVSGSLQTCGLTIALDQVRAAYLRPYDSRQLPSMLAAGADSALWKHTQNLEDLLLTWADLSAALVVNPPAAAASNNSKPYQAQMIRAVGFKTPDTLITTDADAVRAFWLQHKEIIYKSISGTRSIVSRFTPQHLARLEHVRWCPTQFQEWVAGTDYRVHVVGAELFACEIRTQADDYRYASREGADVSIVPCALPIDCASKCIELTRTLNLHLSGIDLRRTPKGEWYCFEVNPSPGFTYYQEATQQPIDEAIASLLLNA